MINLFSIFKATMPLMQEKQFINNNSNLKNTSKSLIWVYDKENGRV